MLMTELPATTVEEWTERHLVTWCAWKHGWYGPAGLPEGSLLFENYSTIDRDSDAAYARLDYWIAETVQVVMDDIGERNPAMKAALYRAYDIVAAFRFKRGNYQQLLCDGRRQVYLGLRRRGVWCGE